MGFMSGVRSHFVLNIPTSGQEAEILRIGSCSGLEVDKFQDGKLTKCEPGDIDSKQKLSVMIEPRERDSSQPAHLVLAGEHTSPSQRRQKKSAKYITSEPLVAVSPCIAHAVCRINEMNLASNGHYRLFASVLYAFVDANYWDGKALAAVDNHSQSNPPVLSFLGSKRFSHILTK
jgi:flavin reductase (DIM6/NTAB) family NADH-FMN oxidoreductase RutF